MQHGDTSLVGPKSGHDDKDRVKTAKLGSAALARLIEEVRVGEVVKLDVYNRTYHRHNR